ncbi:MAG: ATP-binding protein [Hasllibacter sp.]
MSWDTLLIANRGEIAVRIARTARRMGLRTVAVHSDADAGAMHVAACDTAVRIGGNAPADSYLKGDAIIEAAQATGAGAIHPGYGFLSENPDFVEAVEAAGLVFVGPSAGAIRAMGLKDAAKAVMEEAGVPVVPGVRDEQDDAKLAEAAAGIGFPVLVKAVAGGGGKGMRAAHSADEFPEALRAARAEARAAFGNDDVLVEKLIATPRHIEVQVFGDGRSAVHLFERDCSLQRRHQKVIEEAPAPGMTPEMREAMGFAAVRAAEAIGYSGAGTVEFIADGSDGLSPERFYFMEMNTRLQVEHPVTEAITGVDLVEWQLRVAMGQGLPARQADLSITGHAFEARLYAEDPANGFLPVTGPLDRLRWPEGVRIDTGVREGDRITPHYDPMVAKVIAHGPDRRSALAALRRGLEEVELAGTTVNLPFLIALTRHAGFAAGDVDTGLIGRDLDALTAPDGVEPWRLALLALACAGLDGDADHQGFHLWRPLWRRQRMTVWGEDHEVRIAALGGGRFAVDLGSETVEVAREASGWRAGGALRDVRLWHGAGAAAVFGGGALHARVPDPLAVAAEAAKGGVEAPMPGLVREVLVAAGDSVAEGDRLAVMEAMKMEHVLRAPRDGVVASAVAPGAQVEAGAPIVVLEEEDG